MGYTTWAPKARSQGSLKGPPARSQVQWAPRLLVDNIFKKSRTSFLAIDRFSLNLKVSILFIIFPCCWPLFKSSITLLIEHQSLSMGGSSGRELLNNLRRDRLQKLSYETQNSCNSLLVRYFKRMKATCRGFSAQYMGLQLSIIPPGQRFCHRGTLLQILLPVRSNIFF